MFLQVAAIVIVRSADFCCLAAESGLGVSRRQSIAGAVWLWLHGGVLGHGRAGRAVIVCIRDAAAAWGVARATAGLVQ